MIPAAPISGVYNAFIIDGCRMESQAKRELRRFRGEMEVVINRIVK
jgi:hypothetical protein